jgi:hypothetical protein
VKEGLGDFLQRAIVAVFAKSGEGGGAGMAVGAGTGISGVTETDMKKLVLALVASRTWGDHECIALLGKLQFVSNERLLADTNEHSSLVKRALQALVTNSEVV